MPGIYPRMTSIGSLGYGNAPSMASSTLLKHTGPSCLVRPKFDARADIILPVPVCCLYIHHFTTTLSTQTRSSTTTLLPAMLTRDPPILCLFLHLILTIDGGNKSIRFVSDQGHDHRVEVEEEHYEVEP
jgi:hypothetical protein